MERDGGEAGLYEGFEGFVTTEDAELVAALGTALLVPDANALLGLYRYRGAVLEEFLRVFEAVGDRLFVPHRVLDEFWRNRRAVLAGNAGRPRELDLVVRAFADIDKHLTAWHRRTVERAGRPPATVRRAVDQARAAALAHLGADVGGPEPGPDTATSQDPVLRRLEPLLEGRVGPATSPANLADLQREGMERIARRVPPGYLDGEKNPARAVGDFVIWRQTMQAAAARRLPVLFVTADLKADWWADAGSPSMRARPELVAELRATAGTRLHLVRAFDLPALAGRAGLLGPASGGSGGGWTGPLAERLLAVLARRAPAYREVLAVAARDGGIDRFTLARLVGRSDAESMADALAPLTTAVAEVRSTPDAPSGLAVPLRPRYGDGGRIERLEMAEGDATAFRLTPSGQD